MFRIVCTDVPLTRTLNKNQTAHTEKLVILALCLTVSKTKQRQRQRQRQRLVNIKPDPVCVLEGMRHSLDRLLGSPWSGQKCVPQNIRFTEGVG